MSEQSVALSLVSEQLKANSDKARLKLMFRDIDKGRVVYSREAGARQGQLVLPDPALARGCVDAAGRAAGQAQLCADGRAGALAGGVGGPCG